METVVSGSKGSDVIIEFFGPPCVGKTTLASAVADRLRDTGRRVELVLSYRPSEYPLASRRGAIPHLQMPAALRRVSRPIAEAFAAVAHSSDPGDTGIAAELMRLLRSRNVIHSLRLRQYVLRLSRTWRLAATAGETVLFDQGFVQAVCNCAVLARSSSPERVALALDAVPEADLFVRLNAPAEILEARLAERRTGQGRIERLFDAWTGLGPIAMFDRMDQLLRSRGRPIVRVASIDRHSLEEGADRVVAAIPVKLPAGAALGSGGIGC